MSVEATGRSEARYQLAVQVFWDREPGGDLRVLGTIDDGAWRAFVPLTQDFIRTADGSFVDERAGGENVEAEA